MTDLMKRALEAIRSWPDKRQDEAAEILLALDRLGPDAYQASPEELAAIDTALDEGRRGLVVSEDEVAAAFARFRKA